MCLDLAILLHDQDTLGVLHLPLLVTPESLLLQGGGTRSVLDQKLPRLLEGEVPGVSLDKLLHSMMGDDQSHGLLQGCPPPHVQGAWVYRSVGLWDAVAL